MSDEKYMREAIELAKRRKGLTHPNPTVGAVIVKKGQIIGRGFHKKAGFPHAEREAIKDAIKRGYDITGSTMYVTLEPCCHYGRTPPCTEAIIDSRIERVVIATLDPNPQVAGKGVKTLKEKGIKVDVGVLEREAKELNEDFFVYITEKRPYITVKVAQTLDGKIATSTGSSKWITGKISRIYAHKLRNEATAILVGVGTAISDNPSLTVRHIETEKQPVRVLLDKNLKTPEDFKIFDTSSKTIVFISKDAPEDKRKSLEKKENIEIIELPLHDGKFSLKDILSSLYERDIVHLLVEGGKETVTGFIKENLFDRISLFIAPKIVGEDGISSFGNLGIEDINRSITLKRRKIEILGEDIYLELIKE